jgi:uroporphyrinogen-III decarboxylase
MVSNEDKARIHEAYRSHKPIRVPVIFGANPRLVVLDPKWNRAGITFRDYFTSGAVLVEMQLRFMEYRTQYLNQYCDDPTGRPEKFEFYVDWQNSYDSLYFGCPLHYRDGEVPDTTPILAGADKQRLFDFDLDHPLDNPFIRWMLQRYEDIKSAAGRLSQAGVSFSVRPPMLGFDGHLTIATCLRGQELYSDFYEDPPYVHKLLDFIGRAVGIRNQALGDRLGVKAFDGPTAWFADDSIQLISIETYRQFLLPQHRQWYARWSVQGPHFIHLCGDATRFFPLLHRELNVCGFDTGFPVDHGALRRELGPEVELLGGPEVGLLLSGTPERVYARTQAILQSGVMAGGRFMLREANNLPPRVPEPNLKTFYQACLDHGGYGS